MPDTPDNDAYRAAERELLARWPETRLDPTLDRIAALCDLLGEPQRAYPIVHLTGTNGKTSTARMVDSLLRGLGLRTGRATSPHVESMTERISIDGEPLTEERFAEVYTEVAPYAGIIDRSGGHPISFFEFITAMQFAAFADAPVDAAVLEVGMGGEWDATNVADAKVAVITPISVDHASFLGDTPREIAETKSGIIKAGSTAVIAAQQDDAMEVLLRHCAEIGATPVREGVEYGVVDRTPAVDGQLITVQGIGAKYEEIFLPLYGAHQAQNAATAIAAVEAFAGGDDRDGGLDPEVVRTSLGQTSSPARLEVVRSSPTVLLDAAHNPNGAYAAAEALQESFNFSPLIGVVAVMADKDVEGLLGAFEPVMASIVCTQNSTPRSMRAEVLGDIAAGIFGVDRVEVVPRLDDAIERGVSLAESSQAEDIGWGSGGVLVTGSVITAGEARLLFGAG